MRKWHTGQRSAAFVLPPRSMVGQLTLDQHIGVRIPGGQPIHFFLNTAGFRNQLRKSSPSGPLPFHQPFVGFQPALLQAGQRLILNSSKPCQPPCSFRHTSSSWELQQTWYLRSGWTGEEAASPRMVEPLQDVGRLKNNAKSPRHVTAAMSFLAKIVFRTAAAKQRKTAIKLFFNGYGFPVSYSQDRAPGQSKVLTLLLPCVGLSEPRVRSWQSIQLIFPSDTRKQVERARYAPVQPFWCVDV